MFARLIRHDFDALGLSMEIKIKMRNTAIKFAAAGLFALLAAPALAENIEVHMLNKGAEGARLLTNLGQGQNGLRFTERHRFKT
ncbi:pseudoazurin (Cupredoxin) (Blue copper protein) [Brucella vulpis]|nr:pseudoazurin (Cupredoxin) (Blue copper protein) [Brucella vulpis]CUW51958.1 pseudoazurin (Cupredoxin) (Blue copper protein) [Brucella vulpis]